MGETTHADVVKSVSELVAAIDTARTVQGNAWETALGDEGDLVLSVPQRELLESLRDAHLDCYRAMIDIMALVSKAETVLERVAEVFDV